MCGARWAMCSCEAVCVGMARGVARRKNACHTRAVAVVEAASPPPRARGNPLCVCATQPGALCGVCSSRGRGRERGVGEKGARTRRDAGGGLFRLRILVFAGLRG